MASRIANITTPAKLSLPGGAYVPPTAEALISGGKLSISTLRAEYSRLRSVINKRVARAEKAGIDLYSRQGTRVETLPKLSEIKSTRELLYSLSEARGAIISERGTVGGVRKVAARLQKTIDTLGESGFNLSKSAGINAFIAVMDAIRAAKQEHAVGSVVAAQVGENVTDVEKAKGDVSKGDIVGIVKNTLSDFDIPSEISESIMKFFEG